MIRAFEVQEKDDLDEDNPWTGTKATPMQLVFGRDVLII